MRETTNHLKMALCFLASCALAASMLPAAAFAQQPIKALTLRTEATAVSDTGKIAQISLDDTVSAALATDGTLWMWGRNSSGQLGDGTSESRSTPVKALSGVSKFALAGYSSAALKSDGSLWTWGDNESSELGDGTDEDRNSPAKIMSGVSQVVSSGNRFAALKSDGSLWTWGQNSFGELGDGTDEDRNSPVKVMDGVSQVALAETDYGGYSAAIKTDGSLWMWGYNKDSQLGIGSSEYCSTIPVKVMDEVASVSLGSGHSAALKTDGSLWMWGDNHYRALGDGTNENRNAPVWIMDEVASVSLGRHNSAVIKTDGSLWMWGDNYYGQLGDGTEESRATPVKVMDGASRVVLADYRSAAIKTDGSLWMWGGNFDGQLGDGTATNRSVPVKIMEGVSQVALAPMSHSGAIKTDGSVWTWGQNLWGQLGNNATADCRTPVCIFSDGKWLNGGGSGTDSTEKDDPIQYREDEPATTTSIAKASVSVAKMTYNGKNQTPKVTVKLSGKALTKGTDYKVSYLNSKKKAIGAAKVKAAGTYYVRITGIGSYKGSINKKFTIAKHGMDKKSVKAKLAKNSYAWTGKAIKPAIKVYFNGTLMKKGVDYKVSYVSNKNVGKGTVKVTGMGNFTKTTRLFGFKIVKAKQPIKHNLNSDTLRFKYKDIKRGKAFTLIVKGVKEFAPIKVISDKPKIVAIEKKSSGKYVVTPKKPGKAEIKIQTTKATKHYAKTTKKIAVEAADLKEPTITVAKMVTKAITDPAFDLGAKASGSMPIIYKSKNEKIATVDKKGKVTLTGKEGIATIELSVKGNDFFKAGSVNTVIKVVAPRKNAAGFKETSYYKIAKKVLDVPMPNCTTYAYARALELMKDNPDYADFVSGKKLPPFIVPGHSNAKYFWDNNKNSKKPLPYGKKPKVGAIAVWDNGGAGHVAIVEHITSKGVVYYSHSNYGGFPWSVANPVKGSKNTSEFHYETKDKWGKDLTLLGYIYII